MAVGKNITRMKYVIEAVEKNIKWGRRQIL